ncbi:MAG TPA: diacylglycerol kinase family protein [Longimicrobiaceae bacterium]
MSDPLGAEAEGAPLPVIVNASAGLDRDAIADRVAVALREGGVAALVEAVSPDRLVGRLTEGVRSGWRRVAVAGGDGTMLTAAGILAGGPVELAPVPTGTLNHFARRLGIDDLASAAGAMREGAVAEVPLGVMDDRVFLNTATFGLYADVVRRRERLRRNLTKWPAAAVAFVMTLARLRTMDITLLVDGERLERTTSLVWVGVGWGSFPLVHQAPERRARPDLEIVILKPAGALRSLALMGRILAQVRRRDQPIRDRDLEVLHARQLLIHSQRRIGVTLDGEVMRCDPPILIAVADGALRVVAPGGTAASGTSPEG